MVKMVNREKQNKNASGCGSVFIMNLFICCRSIRFDRRIVDADLDVLCVIAEVLAIECQTADMNGILLDCQTETDTAGVVQMEHIDRDIRDFQAIDIGSLFIDDEQLEQTVLVAVDWPPFRCKNTAYISEIPGGRPEAETGIIDIKADI